MLRLAHRILSQPPLRPSELAVKDFGKYKSHWLGVQEVLATCPVIIADNVAAHNTKVAEQGGDWSLTGKNYANIAPPFEGAWFIEWLNPNEDGCMVLPQSGTLFYQVPPEDVSLFGGHFHEDAKWRYVVQRFESNHGVAGVWPSVYAVSVAASGALIGINILYQSDDDERFTEIAYKNAAFLLRVPLLALGYINCSNVGRDDQTKEYGPTPKWCRRMRVPELKYQTIRLGKPGTRRRSPNGSRMTDSERAGFALHICRGHFAHYRKENGGLFGRGKDETIWIPAHARGSREHGQIVSNYEVVAG